MIDAVIHFSLRNRLFVLTIAAVMLIWGGYEATQIPVDVFPDLNRPTVTVMTEAVGLAPEEIETLVTFPLESTLNGAAGVQRVRSASGVGLSIVWVEFEWGSDIYIDRQVVAERLQLARTRLPDGAEPVMTPISSIMGEIMLVGLRSKDGDAGRTTPVELRTIAEWTLRQRLLGIPGVSQVTVLGGELKQYQVVTTPDRLAQYDVTLDELTRAVEQSNVVSGGGFLLSPTEEKLIRIVGRVTDPADLTKTVIRAGRLGPVTVGMAADVRLAGPVRRGAGSVDGEPAVILSIQKQPGADTLALDHAVSAVLEQLKPSLPADVIVDANLFRQGRFIDAAVGNVTEAVRDGALWVVVVLFIFLWNLRTSLITLLAIPLSVVAAALIFRAFGASINTMTLGGVAVAVGELVDDAIVDVENVYRRLKENQKAANPAPALRVVFEASKEVRGSIVYATAVVVLVVTPLFALSGLEGRMFAPLGWAYVLTLLASLVVSLTVTPALASLLLPSAGFLKDERDSFVVRWLKRLDERLLHFTLRRPIAILTVAAVIAAASIAGLAGMGGQFLPDFNEGTLTVSAVLPPATSLQESDLIGRRIEELLSESPEVAYVARRTGRAEQDEHAENVNFSEIEVGLDEHIRPKPGWWNAALRAIPGLHEFGADKVGRPREEVLGEIREKLGHLPGVVVNIGQPISHRLDHVMSGVRAQIAVKVFGPDLAVLRDRAHAVYDAMSEVPGVVDLSIEPQVEIPQIVATVRREAAARYGLRPGDVSTALETALQGRVVSQILEGQRTFDLVVWFEPKARNDIDVIRSTLLSTPSGGRVALEAVADVAESVGPNTINREDVQRRIVVQANVAGRDLASAVAEIQRRVGTNVADKLPPGYFIAYDGQFRAQQDANLRLAVLGAAALVGIFLLLHKALDSWVLALIVLSNIPLAAIGSVLMLLFTSHPSAETLAQTPWYGWPQAWLAATTLSVAHWVGFITLAGIVSRNGIMMITHYQHLMRHEGEGFTEAMIVRGSLERLAPVMMTALTAVIGLVPLALGAGQTGKEILHPLALVVIGGLISSTLLDQVVTPALFWKFGHPPAMSDDDPFAEPARPEKPLDSVP